MRYFFLSVGVSNIHGFSLRAVGRSWLPFPIPGVPGRIHRRPIRQRQGRVSPPWTLDRPCGQYHLVRPAGRDRSDGYNHAPDLSKKKPLRAVGLPGAVIKLFRSRYPAADVSPRKRSGGLSVHCARPRGDSSDVFPLVSAPGRRSATNPLRVVDGLYRSTP
jgi:hypothetical protein